MADDYKPSFLDWIAFISYTLFNPVGMALIVQEAVDNRGVK